MSEGARDSEEMTKLKVDHRTEAEIAELRDILLIYVPFLCGCGFEHIGIGRFSTRGWKCPNCGFVDPDFSFLQHLMDNPAADEEDNSKQGKGQPQ